ncbi:uncharacterized protein HaLaN_32173, partial [Haematococcus lacustris]
EAKVLCLDEATANVDRGTDELIQVETGDDQSVSQAEALGHGVRKRTLSGLKAVGGAGRVLITIAHRIDTIMDADHLL